MLQVYESNIVKIEYNPEQKLLIQTWNGFASSDLFRTGIDKTVEFARKNKVNFIISDTTNQGVVKPDDTEYASSVMPILFSSGLKAMAFVMSKSALTLLSLKSFDGAQKSPNNIKFFTSKADALIWLNTFN